MADNADRGPELLLTNGRIYATGRAEPVYEALAIANGRILALGSSAELQPLAGDNTQVMDLRGAAVLPGLRDAWVNLDAMQRAATAIDLTRTASAREVRSRLLQESAAATGWLVGWGWDETVWPAPELPTTTALNNATAGRPAILYRRNGRVAWLNPEGVDNAGVQADLLARPDGTSSGLITGVALARLEAQLPGSSAADERAALLAALREALAAGITTVATAPVSAHQAAHLGALRDAGELPVRVEVRLRSEVDPAAASLPATDSMLRTVGYGAEADGPWGMWQAATSTPYADGRATPAPSPELADACAAAIAARMPLAVHARGDAAIAEALRCTALTELIGADLVDPGSLPEHVAVAVVPQRLAHDLYWLGARLGDRVDGVHPYRDLYASGKLAGLASMAPAHPLAPLAALRIIHTRQAADGYPIDGFNGRQRLSVNDALASATRAGSPARRLHLVVGAAADLAVWSEDPHSDAEVLGTSRALVVFIDGRVAYSRPLVEPNLDRRQRP